MTRFWPGYTLQLSVPGKLGFVECGVWRVESGVKEEILADFSLFYAQIRKGSGIAVFNSNKSVRICTSTPHSTLEQPPIYPRL